LLSLGERSRETKEGVGWAGSGEKEKQGNAPRVWRENNKGTTHTERKISGGLMTGFSLVE
jgi:hypothetical protein